MRPQSDTTGTLRRHQPNAFTLVELLVVITVIGVLIGLLLPAIQAAREAARRSSCSNNLRQLGIAMQSYHDTSRRFPPGAHLHSSPNLKSISWRVMILPYLEETTIYEQINPSPDGGATWWGPQQTPMAMYLCPSAPPPEGDFKESHYSGVMGPGRGDLRIDLEENLCGDIYTDGMFFPESRTRIAKIEDGTSHTLAIGERSYKILWPWMEGAHWTGTPPTRICTNALHNVTYPMNTDPNEFGYFGDTTSANPIVRLNNLFFGSLHNGGAQFCYADASVHLVSDSIDFTLFGDLATIAGREAGSSDP